jgi:hypothetical protein
MVTLYIGIADYEWFRYLSAREDRTGLDALLKAVARREIGSLQWSDGALNFGGCAELFTKLFCQRLQRRLARFDFADWQHEAYCALPWDK